MKAQRGTTRALLSLGAAGLLVASMTSTSLAAGRNGTTLIDAAKEAHAHSTLTYPWTITKSVNPTVVDMFAGDTAQVLWTVTATKGAPVLRTWVDGQFCFTNGGAVATEGMKIVDQTPVGPIAIDTSANPVLDPGEKGCYPFSYEVTGAKVGDLLKDKAYVTILNHSGSLGTPKGTQAAASATVPAPTVVNDAVDVTDSNGMSWHLTDSKTVTYPQTFDKAGTYTNTAVITQTGDKATAKTTVNTYALAVAKTASTSYQRDWSWSIEKTGEVAKKQLAKGETTTATWRVTVTPTKTDSKHTVFGTITVSNPAPIAAPLTKVVDSFGGTDIKVTCPSLTVAPKSQLVCSYTQALDGKATGTNVATATLQNRAHLADGTTKDLGTTDVKGTAAVTFGQPSTENDECVTVTDTLSGALGTVCGEAKTFTYTTTVDPAKLTPVDPKADPLQYVVKNVATVVTNDSGTKGDDDATVGVTVPNPPVTPPCDCTCPNKPGCDTPPPAPVTKCTLTQGYWKTHSAYGPARYDKTWALLPQGEKTTFFRSGMTWMQLFGTAPRGSAYVQLAHQYMAAQLNVLSGASTTPEVDAAMAQAKAIFEHTLGTTLSKTDAAKALALASLLDRYNNGLVGPGHCG